MKAVLVGIQLPQITVSELESSLLELTRLVSTLGYQVIGQVTQRRGTDRGGILLGEGKLQDLARWTQGSGKVASSVKRKKLRLNSNAK